MRCLRRALLLCGLLLGIGLYASCAPGILVLVNVTGLTPEAQSLKVTLTFNNVRSPETFEVTTELGQFALRLPNRADQRGLLRIDVAAFAADQCRIGSGNRVIDTAEGQALSYDATVALQASPSGKQCPLSLGITGTGRVNYMPKGGSCDSSCELEFDSGSMVTLDAAIGPQSLPLEWTGACSGPASMKCTVTMQGPRSVGVSFGTQSCSPDKWCVFSGGGGGAVTTQELRAIWGSGPDDVWFVGGVGTILHWNGIALTLMPPPSGVTETLTGLWGASANDIWAVGFGGRILHYANNLWSQSSSGTTADLYSVFGISSSDVYAVGTGGNIRRWTGAWGTKTSNTTYDFHGVWRFATLDGWAVGPALTLYEFHPVQDQLRAPPSGVSGNLRGVWGSSISDVWAVGDSGQIIHTSGSAIWTKVMTTNTTSNLYGVWGTGAMNIWAVGNSGTILQNAGGAWIVRNSGVTQNLRAIWGASASDIWAVGEGGTILHYKQ